MTASPSRNSGVGFHPEAENDLEQIAAYIAENSPGAARKVILAIQTAITAVVSLPHQGHRREDLTERPLRFVTIYDYLIAYAPDKQPLWVLAVLHGSRDPELITTILENRAES